MDDEVRMDDIRGMVLFVPGLQSLIDLLRERGWAVIGPTVRDGAVVHAEIESVDQLPRGVGDLQDAGSYRLRERDDEALFGFAAGPQAWKSLLFPSRELLWSGRRVGAEKEVTPAVVDAKRLALFGVRSCDLHALAIHDRVLAKREVTDTAYVARREATFIVALTCSDPGGTCFCVSMGTGPVPDEGFDLALTELLDQDGHRFLVVPGSDRGQEVLDDLKSRAGGGEVMPAGEQDHLGAQEVGAAAAQHMGRSLDTKGLRDLLYAHPEHPRWADVASRCLACTNCTLVCPTCFCTSVDVVSDLTGSATERWRVWDSCFTTDFSYLHGGSVRDSVQSRYRQWATHKLASWVDQFGTSGCVGCGRCITWCPAAIDLTAEVAAIRSGKE
ncbi:MAG: sulfite reductase subunit A [Phycicoccus sp.]|nr:sulfite reductase subunit A [Phycicoccus sp.]NMM32848.1 sulfite reductase subunit A [Phycicoccus sp.]